MKELIQPKLHIPFKLPNGVSLKASAYVRMIKNSSRVDAKPIGIDWDSMTVEISLDSEEYGPALIRASLDECSLDDDRTYLDEKILPVAVALGSADYFHIMQNTLLIVVHNVKQMKKD